MDGFAIYGLTEYALASGREEPLAWARKTADRVLDRLRSPPDQIPHFPYPVPAGARVDGGILLAVDARGGGEVGWKFSDFKLWWPHTEALYGLLLAYEMSGEPWCLEWYERVHDYSFRHYPVPHWGEWRQKLKRNGAEATDTVALPVKDPFHLPRALYYCIETLDRIVASRGRGGP